MLCFTLYWHILTIPHVATIVPSKPTVTGFSSMPYTIWINWSDEINVDMYLVTWKSGSVENFVFLPARDTDYTITNLDAGSSYMITVTANNSAGSSESDAVLLTTGILCRDDKTLSGIYIIQTTSLLIIL